MSKETFLTIEESADYTGKHPQTIRRWIKDHKLPARRLGREYRVAEADLDAMYQPVQAEPQAIEA